MSIKLPPSAAGTIIRKLDLNICDRTHCENTANYRVWVDNIIANLCAFHYEIWRDTDTELELK